MCTSQNRDVKPMNLTTQKIKLFRNESRNMAKTSSCLSAPKHLQDVLNTVPHMEAPPHCILWSCLYLGGLVYIQYLVFFALSDNLHIFTHKMQRLDAFSCFESFFFVFFINFLRFFNLHVCDHMKSILQSILNYAELYCNSTLTEAETTE